MVIIIIIIIIIVMFVISQKSKTESFFMTSDSIPVCCNSSDSYEIEIYSQG